MSRRILSIFMSVVLCVGLMPLPAFAQARDSQAAGSSAAEMQAASDEVEGTVENDGATSKTVLTAQSLTAQAWQNTPLHQWFKYYTARSYSYGTSDDGHVHTKRTLATDHLPFDPEETRANYLMYHVEFVGCNHVVCYDYPERNEGPSYCNYVYATAELHTFRVLNHNEDFTEFTYSCDECSQRITVAKCEHTGGHFYRQNSNGTHNEICSACMLTINKNEKCVPVADEESGGWICEKCGAKLKEDGTPDDEVSYKIIYEDDKPYCVDQDDKKTNAGWVKCEGAWYNATGAGGDTGLCLTECFANRQGSIYFLGADGAAVTSRWIEENVGGGLTAYTLYDSLPANVGREAFVYHAGSGGSLTTGWDSSITAGVKRHFDETTGRMARGYETVEGEKHHFAWADGGLCTNRFTNIDNKQCRADDAGVVKAGWLAADGATFYTDDDGVMSASFSKVDGKSYYFEPTEGDTYGAMKSGGMFKVGEKTYYAGLTSELARGWTTVGGVQYYFQEEAAGDGYGYRLEDGLFEVEGKYYLFSPNGVVQTGRHVVEGKAWFLTATGHQTDDWFKDNDGTYYYLVAGDAKTGWHDDGWNRYYLLPPDGPMQIGRIEVEGETYFMTSSGKLQTGWVDYEGKRYYADPQTGSMWKDKWVYDAADSYHVGPDGVMQTGKLEEDGEVYFFALDGKRIHTGWCTDTNGDRYYVDSWVAEKGWATVGGEKYYLDPHTGVLQTGKQVIDGKTYFLDKTNGAAQKGWVAEGDDWYFADRSSGAMLTGLIQDGSSKYYMDKATGKLMCGMFWVDGKLHISGSTGYVSEGWMRLNGEKYFTDSDGLAVIGPATIGKNWYYFGEDGAVKTGFFKGADGKSYYADERGRVKQSGTFELDGRQYQVGPDGSVSPVGGGEAPVSNANFTIRDGQVVSATETASGVQVGGAEESVPAVMSLPPDDGLSVSATIGADGIGGMFTDAEKQAMADGAAAQVTMTVSQLDAADVPAADKASADAALESVGSTAGAYLDFSLYKQVGSDAKQQVEHVGGAGVSVAAEVPASLREDVPTDSERTYEAWRIHDYGDGNGPKADKLAETKGTVLNFDSPDFSTYVIAYRDEQTQADPGSGSQGAAEPVTIAAVNLSATSLPYTGKAQRPKVVSVTALGMTVPPSAYEVSYSDSLSADVGTYKVVVTARAGGFAGSLEETYSITRAANKVTLKKASVKKGFKAKALAKKAKAVALPKATAQFGKVSWKVAKKDKKKVLSLNAKTGEVKVKKGSVAGTYTIKVKASVPATRNYRSATTKAVTVKVTVK